MRLILWHLRNGKLRFGELQKRIPAATPKMLAQCLRELENDGLIIRKAYPVVPPKTEYALSPHGQTALPVIEAIAAWGAKYSGCYRAH